MGRISWAMISNTNIKKDPERALQEDRLQRELVWLRTVSRITRREYGWSVLFVCHRGRHTNHLLDVQIAISFSRIP